MDSELVADLADRAFSYSEIGATGVSLPDGFHHVARNEVVGHGAAAFARAAETLMGWGMHRGAGLTVRAESPRAATGVNVMVSFGPTWLAVNAPCRVVHTVDQPDRVGFTYGTLHGHPVSGEESFSVLLDADDSVRFVLIAFSRPAQLLTKLSGPVGRLAGDRIADRYLAAIRSAARLAAD
jgi:uncharacterized protein (UPF0548 family)